MCITQGCTESLWLGEMLCRLAEILRLQDPGSVQLEMVSVANSFPDLRYHHSVRVSHFKQRLGVCTYLSKATVCLLVCGGCLATALHDSRQLCFVTSDLS